MSAIRRSVPLLAFAALASGCGDLFSTREVVLPRFAAVGAFLNHSCALTVDGAAYCWGGNSAGELGTGWDLSPVPVAVRVAGNLRFREISGGSGHSCGITTGGETYCWGAAARFGRGGGDERARTPVRATEVPLATLSGGSAAYNLCGTTAAGEAYCGSPSAPALTRVAEGHRFDRIAHTQSTVPPTPGEGGRYYGFWCGLSGTEVRCWGDNRHGELGTGDRAPAAVPAPVASLLAFRAVGTGFWFACALAQDGAAHCWGRGAQGSLGTGSTADALAPVPVAGGHRFATLSVGFAHACGVTAEGAAWCWGENGDQQLGAPGSGSVPVRVEGEHRWATVSAGAQHTCGVTTEGRLFCWGGNGDGQLGEGTRSPRPAPVPVAFPR